MIPTILIVALLLGFWYGSDHSEVDESKPAYRELVR